MALRRKLESQLTVPMRQPSSGSNQLDAWLRNVLQGLQDYTRKSSQRVEEIVQFGPTVELPAAVGNGRFYFDQETQMLWVDLTYSSRPMWYPVTPQAGRIASDGTGMATIPLVFLDQALPTVTAMIENDTPPGLSTVMVHDYNYAGPNVVEVLLHTYYLDLAGPKVVDYPNAVVHYHVRFRSAVPL